MISRIILFAIVSVFHASMAFADITSADNARARGDYDTAIAEYQTLAENGNVVAQATLGYMLYVGEGVNQNYDNAIYWYAQAAESGNADAQYNLAVAYAFGEGLDQNFSEAVNWYSKAAEQDHAIAQYSLGLSFSYGEGVGQDPVNAAYWFSRAAENGYTPSQVLLGSKFHTGDGVPQNYEEAARWYAEAAAQGDSIAQFNLGSMYRAGTGVDKDINEAIKWYRLSSQQGYSTATTELAKLENELATHSNSQPSMVSSATPMEELPAPVEERQAIPDSISSTANDSTTLTSLSGLPSIPLETTENMPITSDLLSIDSVDPKLPVENAIATEQLLSESSTMRKDEQVDAEPASMEDSKPEESRSFFSRLFSRSNKNSTETTQEIEDEVMSDASDMVSTESNTMEEPAAAVEVDQSIIAENQKEASRGFFSRLFKKSPNEDAGLPMEEVAEPEVAAMAEGSSMIEIPVEAVAEIDFNKLNNLYEQGETELRNENYEEAVKLFRTAAAQGDPKSQYKIGTLHYQGLGLRQDYDEASLWYRRSAEQGNVDAQYSLGNMYLMGEGIPQNDVQARHWYNEAAAQGHVSAKHNLQNLDRFSQTNELMTEDISNEIEEIEEIDDTLTLDVEQAAENAVIDQESPENMLASVEPITQSDAPSSLAAVDYERGLAYSFGEGVEKNLNNAFEYFRKAAEKNYAPAQYKLGIAYAYAEGTTMDKSQAVYWYQKAAIQGHIIAQRNLGVMFENGEGVEQNKTMALAWYSIIADSGNVMDIRRKETLLNELQESDIAESERLKNNLLAEINSN